MSGIYGALGINDTDRVFLSTLGQRVVYDAVRATLDKFNADLAATVAVFVDETTSDHKLRYKLAGGGRLQERGGRAQTAVTKATGQWDVAFPLKEYGTAVGWSRTDYAYMTAQDLNRHLDTVQIQGVNTVRFEILKALLNNAQRTFADQMWGNLSIEPLANGDSVTYPPVLGSESEATDNHYLESGYAAASISDTNNPFVTIKDELEEHFGTQANGSDIVVFFNQAQTAKVEALTAFDPVNDRYVTPGSQTAVPTNLPGGLPGVVRGRVSDVWAVEWRWMPAGYMLAINLAPGIPKPLMQRIDPIYTGLGTGLKLVATNDDYPFTESSYEHRFGFGCGNRLNGVVMEFGTGGTYTIPSGYS